MPSSKRKFGDIGENRANEFLLQKGYKIIDKNYRIKNLGEIDLIGEKDNKITFFEVKTRHVKRQTNFPIEFSINEKKRRNLKRICQLYILDKHSFTDKDWQVDALFVKVNDNGEYTIEHLENILWERYY